MRTINRIKFNKLIIRINKVINRSEKIKNLDFDEIEMGSSLSLYINKAQYYQKEYSINYTDDLNELYSRRFARKCFGSRDLSIKSTQLITVIVAIITMLLLFYFLQKTKMGK